MTQVDRRERQFLPVPGQGPARLDGPGIVDEHVELLVLDPVRLGGGADRFQIAEIAGQDGNSGTPGRRANRGRSVLGLVAVAPEECHVGTESGQAERSLVTDSGAAAGYQN